MESRTKEIRNHSSPVALKMQQLAEESISNDRGKENATVVLPNNSNKINHNGTEVKAKRDADYSSKIKKKMMTARR
jgi:hypothetical protein